MAQTGPTNYQKKWERIDSLIYKKGLTQSALSEVKSIYTLARQDNNSPQMIKALIYQMGLQEMSQEDALKNNIRDMEKELASSTPPVRSILESILADRYWDYFRQNRWKFYNRTATTGFVKGDITTWDVNDFHKRIGELYTHSLADEKLLEGVRLDSYDPILVKGNVRMLRPTLFDLLAHQALHYFKNDERDLNKPEYIFEINDPDAFADAQAFTGHTFRTSDSSSLHYSALRLFQRLIRSHLDDQKPDALLDVDIERLQFVHTYSTLENKDALFMNALARLTGRYGMSPIAAQAWHLQAQQYFTQAGHYDPLKDTAGRYGYVRAKEICEKVIAGISEGDSSEGRTQCEQLLKSILHKEVYLQTEKINLPGQPMRSLVSWRNIGQVWFRLIRVDRSIKDNLGINASEDDYWKKLLQLPVMKTFSQDLPETGDYQLHRAEIKIDALPVGEYALVGNSLKEFSLTQGPLVVQFFHVSGIAWFNRDRDFFIVDRESGQPLNGAAIQIWNRTYDYKVRHFLYNKAETYRADDHGHFLLHKKTGEDRNLQQSLEITTAADHLFLTDEGTIYYYQSPEDAEGRMAESKTKYEKDNRRTFFFTDRSIYRPGQTLYFKGIVVTRNFDTRQSVTCTSFKTKINLYDANGSKVDSLELVTNDFGSYHGQFTLPEGLLNGEFRIEDDSTGNSQNFRVEEYKRPKFYVSFEKLKGSHRLDDTLTITGSAKAYSGNALDGARVRYRVVREARFPHPWLYWRIGIPEGRVQEIAHGEVQTGADGSFAIRFNATADHQVDKKLDPVFVYKITADVTDINGETRSGETSTEIGYKTLTLALHLPGDHLPADSLKSFTVRAANLSGEPEKTPVTITLFSLRSPDRLIRQRYWQQPDQFVLSEKEYLAAFPHDIYRDEDKKESWERTEVPATKVVEQSGGNAAQSTGVPEAGFRLQGDGLKPGWYVIEAKAKDIYGQEVKDIRYVELYEGKTGRPAAPQYNWSLNRQGPVEPGGKAIVQAGSSASDVFLIRTMDHNLENRRPPVRPLGIPRKNSPASSSALQKPEAGNGDEGAAFRFIHLNRDGNAEEFPVTEADRGGFGVFDVFVKDNRFYTNSNRVDVPWTNKDLSINYSTFRDKVLPGSEEKWQVQIKGPKAEKVVSEVLAGMYDASLDQFSPHSWEKPDLYPVYQGNSQWDGTPNFSTVGSREKYFREETKKYFVKVYDRILDLRQDRMNVRFRGLASGRVPAPMMRADANAPLADADGSKPLNYNGFYNSGEMNVKAEKMKKADDAAMDSEGVAAKAQAGAGDQGQGVQVRSNFKETAFFFPDLRTDADGNVSFSFTMPEALTRWKWMTLAHTRDLAFIYEEKNIVTQKDLMVQPNAPRFLREGDRMELSVKVVNLTDSEMTGQVSLQLVDPITGKTADGLFSNRQPYQYFTAGAKGSAVVSFPLEIPYQYNRPLQYRIIANARQYSDGESAVLPVVSNRMLVTETLPLNMPGNGTRKFQFDKLLASGNSETLNNHALTVEFTANPAWYAVQALPYLMEYPYECAEQIFNRFYANALASKIAGSSPRIRAIFDKWKTTDTAALLSNLQKNQELKSVLLEETPWVLQAKTESQQKKNIALLFDMVRMSRELESALNKLQDLQSPNGGFVWFKGGEDNRYITQYILTGIGHLQKLNAIPPAMAGKINAVVSAAIPYLDQRIKEDYAAITKKGNPLSAGKKGPIQWGGGLPVQYLYMRSFFINNGIPGDVMPAVTYFRKQAQQSWLQQGRYLQGMIALALFRTGDVQTAKDIIASLRQNAIRDEEKGMYWKGVENGFYWYQAPIETQSLLIEAFREVGKDAVIDRDLKTWLLKQKQTQSWRTTKATADACYALLLGGSDWLSEERHITIQLGDKVFSSGSSEDGTAGAASDKSSTAEAGTGYFKRIVDGQFVKPSMGNITVTMAPAGQGGSNATGGSNTGSQSASGAGSSPAWGAIYWQYFDNLDRITPPGSSKAPLKLVKKLFVEKNTDRGPILEPVAENGVLHVGDKVKVRIELQSDRDLEFVHMKDMRASCMEPVNVISEYKWQGGLGYYESTKDASTNFFFGWLPRGTYVFEYPLFVNQNGNFSNGVTSIECMYAPEFAYHSEGIRVNVEATNP